VHLFTIGVGLSPDEERRLAEELRRTAGLYPQLDHDAAWQRRPGDGVFVGGVASPVSVSAPRVYVHESPTELVFYDGLPLDPSGVIAAHHAAELAVAWDRLPAVLEGRFGAVRIRFEPLEIELINDAIGVEQLYVAERSGTSIISNSAGLIARALGDRGEDPLGVSMFLTVDWVGGDRTLRQGVRVLPGAQRWAWRAGDPGWSKGRYWSYADAEPPVRRVDSAFADEVGGALGRFCSAAAAVNGSLNAPLTGGKDSRMLAAVLIGAGVPAEYWTKGLSESRDVQIALEVAARYGLPHRLSGRPTEDPANPPAPVLDDWEALTQQFVAQNDGLPSLFLVGNIHGQPARVDRLAVTLSAMCAESARRATAQAYLDQPGSSLARAARYLPYAWINPPHGLVRGEAHRLARTHLRETVHRLADEGVPLTNLSAVLYLDERCRRWATNNPRELAQTEDKVLPFLTRPYVDAVLASHPHDRATHQVHRQIINRLVPGMDTDPPVDWPWFEELVTVGRSQVLVSEVMSRLPFGMRRAYVAVRDRLRTQKVEWESWTPFDEASWLESQLPWARETALSRESSPVWSYLHRPVFERLLDPRTDAGERRLNQLPLYAALTMFLYEDLEQRMAAS